jgi:uncharacterized protein YjiK
MKVPLYRPLLLTALFLSGMVLSSCQMFWSPKSPRGYVMPRPKKIILDKKVNEISGLFYLRNENAMLAIADNKQKIYRVTQDGKINSYFEGDFGPSADYEDVVMVDSVLYVLISDGSVTELKQTDSGLQTTTYPFPQDGKNDFETLYYDTTSNGLILLCKNCEADRGQNIRTAYRFDRAGKQFDTTPYYTISSKEVKNSLKDGKVDFEPSAAAVHPLEKRLYVLASSGNLLVITDFKGKVQEVYRLNPTLYPQAEGIAFAPNGDLYISNEAKLGKPTLLYIPYKPSGK